MTKTCNRRSSPEILSTPGSSILSTEAMVTRLTIEMSTEFSLIQVATREMTFVRQQKPSLMHTYTDLYTLQVNDILLDISRARKVH